MKVSVVIVNYNVRNFLEQCLQSVIAACKGFDHEIFVVDNHSVDGSQAMVKSSFPEVRLIENNRNLGFSKANNQALRLAQGQYQLVLNPDTLLEEQTIRKCIEFMDSHPEAGALGVKMINGRGKFLPESRRSLPTPSVAFYKMFGLANLFPRSKRFARYHMGFMPVDKTHPVEVLSGAFMFLRKEALEKAGLFDEDYFMYGEDIDLSYRLLKQGFVNYYFPETTIIHYKGESTKKSSINYVKTFYSAMLVFIHKHFSHQQNSLFYFLLKLGIYFRGFISAGKRILGRIFLPFTDAILFYTGLLLMTMLWENIKFSGEYFYPPLLKHYIFPVYVVFWMIGLFLSGAYKRYTSLKQGSLGILYGTFAILVLYSLLPEYLRFSRAIVLFGATASLLAAVINRKIAEVLKISRFQLFRKPLSKIAFTGSPAENEQLLFILNEGNQDFIFLGNIYDDKDLKGINHLGNTGDLEEIVSMNRINEIIFSSRDLSIRQIIQLMNRLSGKNISFKILSADGETIVGAGPGTRDFLRMR